MYSARHPVQVPDLQNHPLPQINLLLPVLEKLNLSFNVVVIFGIGGIFYVSIADAAHELLIC